MSGDIRIERDSLGEVRVPANALYGAQTQRALENFPISGQRFPRRFIRALGLVKRVAALTNGELSLIDQERAQAIATAAREVEDGTWDEEFVLDVYQTGSGTSTNMNANEVIASRAAQLLEGEGLQVHPNDHVNFGQSSNDVIPTALHVSARISLLEDLIPALESLESALRKKSEAFDGVLKSGRTHLMDATPIRLGQEFAGWARQVELGKHRVEAASDELAELALGGTATGTGINTHEQFPTRAIKKLSAFTGIPFLEARDHFEAQGAKDGAVAVSGALNTVATSLMKVADDIRWLASGPTSGIGELLLPAVQPGSSIMPGKVNPVLSEALMMVAARVMGNHSTITIAGSRGNLELNTMMPVLTLALLESIELLARGCRAFTDRCVVGIEADPARCRELLEKNPAVATALNLRLGYEVASEVAKEAVRDGATVREVVLRRGLVPEDELDEILNVRHMTEGGLDHGSR
ncbi:MAG: class II fumarate hydratase [Gemmatimonadetes bacterium]|nr:class II fumarate hydratase [Gemmatimonadota bacterium]NNM05958.1 class II fumarate hydratase [Gemmatimonadota bacterium]